MRKKICLMQVLFLTMALACSSPVYAQEYTTEVTNNVTMGDISISLNEYGLDEAGNEVAYNRKQQVIPGEKIDNIVRITNHANACWLRMKAEYTGEEGLASISDNDLTLASDNWEKIGEYYYYEKPLKTGEMVDFVKRVTIPHVWDESYAEKDFSIIMTADAVQEANFEPDWNSEDPWFGTVIETCVHTSYDPKFTQGQEFSVVFENGSEGLVHLGDDFFSNWSSLMPGDTAIGSITMKNQYAKNVTMYFHTETIADDALLKVLQLEIKNGSETIYAGTMDGAVKDNIKLTTLAKDQTATLTYTVTVPKNLNNQYALASTKTKWIFTADLPNSSGGSGGSSSGGGGGSGTHSGRGDDSRGPGSTRRTPENQDSDTFPPETEPTPINDNGVSDAKPGKARVNPKTGDDSQVGMYLAFTGLFGCAAAGILIAGKNQKKKEKRNDET